MGPWVSLRNEGKQVCSKGIWAWRLRGFGRKWNGCCQFTRRMFFVKKSHCKGSKWIYWVGPPWWRIASSNICEDILPDEWKAYRLDVICLWILDTLGRYFKFQHAYQTDFDQPIHFSYFKLAGRLQLLIEFFGAARSYRFYPNFSLVFFFLFFSAEGDPKSFGCPT